MATKKKAPSHKPVKKAPAKRGRVTPKKAVELRVDLGCGQVPLGDGWCGVDLYADGPGIIKHDLRVAPWPFDDGSVTEARCVHFFEHLTGPERILFMNELYRVLKVGSTCQIITPHAWSNRAVQDPTHQWPPVVFSSYFYFDQQWLADNGLGHYLTLPDGSPNIANFDFNAHYSLNAVMNNRNEQYRNDAVSHFVNAADDLIVTVQRRP